MTTSEPPVRHRVLEILEALIARESVNPAYTSTSPGEGAVADYVEQLCRAAGLKVTRQPVLPGRDNIIAEVRVGRPEHTLLFEAHMDTVGLGSMVDPLVPTYQDGRLYGRGACDTKSSLAGMLYAMEMLAAEREHLNGDVVLCASVDEEHAYRGLSAFLELGMPLAGAIVGEPTERQIVIAHKGCVRCAIHTHGRAAHSSVPHTGDNAIYQMAQVIAYLRDEVVPTLASITHPLCGSPSLVVATITGGEQVNIVPERCTIRIDRRINPGEDARAVFEALRADLLARFAGQDVHISVEEQLVDWALDTAPDEQIVRVAQQTAATQGLDSQLLGVPYGSDASKLQRLAGVPSIVFGPGSIAQAHASDEWVAVDQVIAAAAFYRDVARRFGGSKQSAVGSRQ